MQTLLCASKDKYLDRIMDLYHERGVPRGQPRPFSHIKPSYFSFYELHKIGNPYALSLKVI